MKPLRLTTFLRLPTVGVFLRRTTLKGDLIDAVLSGVPLDLLMGLWIFTQGKSQGVFGSDDSGVLEPPCGTGWFAPLMLSLSSLTALWEEDKLGGESQQTLRLFL
jgi:hypothetical protein